MAELEEEINKEREPISEPGAEMSFLGHLGELRKRIIWSIVGITIGCIIAGIFVNKLIDYVLLLPATHAGLNLQNLKPFGQPFLFFKIILVAGLIFGFPFTMFQLWKFVAPGLYQKERKWVRTITFFTSICFLIGVAFAYFVMIPSMLAFAASFGTDKIKNIIDINEYFSFLTTLLLAAGLLFEMPMLVYVLSRLGIVTPKLMRKYRRHSIVIILILAAVITPTPDPISQLIFAAPLFILYELSIIVSKLASKKAADKI